VRLAGNDDLDRPLGRRQDVRQASDVAEQERRALVGRHAPREADRQRVEIEHAADGAEHAG
jgi:hypothetical protein